MKNKIFDEIETNFDDNSWLFKKHYKDMYTYVYIRLFSVTTNISFYFGEKKYKDTYVVNSEHKYWLHLKNHFLHPVELKDFRKDSLSKKPMPKFINADKIINNAISYVCVFYGWF